MKSLDQLDPLPKLGSKIETEVVYFHTEEKEVGPHLYEKDGKLSYRPPEPMMIGLADLIGEFRRDPHFAALHDAARGRVWPFPVAVDVVLPEEAPLFKLTFDGKTIRYKASEGPTRYCITPPYGLPFYAEPVGEDALCGLRSGVFDVTPVEEEKQDNKPVTFSSGPGRWVPEGPNSQRFVPLMDGWYAHRPGDPMPCDPEMKVAIKCNYRSIFKDDDYEDEVIENNGVEARDIGWEGAVVAWRPA